MAVQASCRLPLLAGLALAAACATTDAPTRGDGALEGLALTEVQPRSAVPGTTIVLTGESFVDEPWGTAKLRLRGSYAGAPVDLELPVRFVDYDRLELDFTPTMIAALGASEGEFIGDAIVQIHSSVDGELYSTEPMALTLEVKQQLAPRLDSIQTGGILFTNDHIQLFGDGLLLGGDEGTSYARIQGCFTPEAGGACAPVTGMDLPITAASGQDRTAGSFAFVPDLAGIQAGTFTGLISVHNAHANGVQLTSDAVTVTYELLEAAIFSVDTQSASLAQYVDITGAGFVSPEQGGSTMLHLTGTLEIDGVAGTLPTDLYLVPEFQSGKLVRYVLSETDELGELIDLRTQTGVLRGQLTPMLTHGATSLSGEATAVTLRVASVKQVVWLQFLPSYRESLRHFGLRAVDDEIRQRIITVLRRNYATINVEFRTQQPTDFAHYSIVELSGPDPNGRGLLGYDNTPGKDVGNQHLWDRIGGVNAETQQNGYPGFGGVFIESLFGFSRHPGAFATSSSSASSTFDDIFDPFRADRGGEPVLTSDLQAGIDVRSAGTGCPATSRTAQIECAIFALGTLIGTTTSHEIGHSLGLANPDGALTAYHNSGDRPGRLMDAGADIPFLERAELLGQTPASFCDEAYQYLRRLMPTDAPADPQPRPSCR